MREINTHKVAGDTAPQLSVHAADAPGAGGANHIYTVSQPDGQGTLIRFQNGPIKEVGVNGLTQETLLAVVIDRLECFQRGPFACVENGEALDACKNAMVALQARTHARIARGVEGKNVA